MRKWIPLMSMVPLLVAACGGGETSLTSGDSTTPTPAAVAETRYTTTATVLQSERHGPQLCLGGMNDSYPPQCGGPDVIGWDWRAVEGEESAHGTTWGSYTVLGTWDGKAFTLTEPPRPPDPTSPSAADEGRFATPCPTPDGGWKVVDSRTATDDALNRAETYGRAQAGVGGVWVDQSINPAAQHGSIDEAAMNDPTKLVLNMSFTGDLKRQERAVREIWGGALCISRASLSAAELEDIRREVEAEAGRFWWSSTDEVRGRIEIGVTVDDGLQQRLDERYGEGVVKVDPAFEPVTG